MSQHDESGKSWLLQICRPPQGQQVLCEMTSQLKFKLLLQDCPWVWMSLKKTCTDQEETGNDRKETQNNSKEAEKERTHTNKETQNDKKRCKTSAKTQRDSWRLQKGAKQSQKDTQWPQIDTECCCVPCPYVGEVVGPSAQLCPGDHCLTVRPCW